MLRNEHQSRELGMSPRQRGWICGELEAWTVEPVGMMDGGVYEGVLVQQLVQVRATRFTVYAELRDSQI